MFHLVFKNIELRNRKHRLVGVQCVIQIKKTVVVSQTNMNKDMKQTNAANTSSF